MHVPELRSKGDTADHIDVGRTLNPGDSPSQCDRQDIDPVAPSRVADEQGGVMVISAWPYGVAGLLLARVTMTAPGGTLSVRAAKGPRELHDVVDEWLTGMGEA